MPEKTAVLSHLHTAWIRNQSRPHASQDQVQQDSGLHPRTTAHLAYRAREICIVDTSISEPARPSFVREYLMVSDGPSVFIPRLTHGNSIELVTASEASTESTRYKTLPLETARRRDRRRSLKGDRARLTPSSHSAKG